MLPNCSIVAAYMTDADLYAARSKCVANYLRKQLRKAAQTASRLDGYTLDSTPSIAAAASSQMDRIAGKNWLAVGDAAAAFDPLSSHGHPVCPDVRPTRRAVS